MILLPLKFLKQLLLLLFSVQFIHLETIKMKRIQIYNHDKLTGEYVIEVCFVQNKITPEDIISAKNERYTEDEISNKVYFIS